MPINPKVIEAVSAGTDWAPASAEWHARRVLLAQAECVSDGMVDAAAKRIVPILKSSALVRRQSWIDWDEVIYSLAREIASAAIAAALRFGAGE